ncbi:MAG: sn-glycerol-3-phosphate ABC transporter ATP-binding protein UgpC [Eubacterium sp.]|nr:sn-glycerol-3-phosphate ABC transporter ATP-binding protein UgpC [Eubacterium sp.]MDE6505963.1 sn-glycerol-3-phosphate ABC transporter ATP-binding protein UgpC [Eubacterium sp.]
MASIKFKNVAKIYDGKTTVIPDLNLEIKDKEFVILVGPSGCGKSTTLRMIAGLEDVSQGELYIGDKLVNNVSPKDRDIAMVFQSYALYPHMSVYKNMAFALKLRKLPKDEIDKKVRAAAKMLDIEKYLSRKPKALSGGQRQRVALGRAMVREPEVFLLDEPLSNLDAKLRTEMRSRISVLHKELQTTFVYVTHDQTEAMTMADRIVVMRDGVIQQTDTPSNLYNHPVNTFVAGFIGTPQMNFIRAGIEKTGIKTELVFSENRITVPQRMESALADYIGKEVTLGIRPDDFHFEEFYKTAEGSNRVTLVSENCELTGSEINIYSHIGEARVIARVASDIVVDDGSSVSLFIDTEKIHIFNKETGELICD